MLLICLPQPFYCYFFFFNDTATTEIYTLSLHDALPICLADRQPRGQRHQIRPRARHHQRIGKVPGLLVAGRSEEHTSELQSPCNLVCRLLLEKKKQFLQRLNVKLRLSHLLTSASTQHPS